MSTSILTIIYILALFGSNMLLHRSQKMQISNSTLLHRLAWLSQLITMITTFLYFILGEDIYNEITEDTEIDQQQFQDLYLIQNNNYLYLK